MEKASVKLISLAVAVAVEAILITIMAAMLGSVRETASTQMQALEEVQSEYGQRDAALLDGEIVSAAEAASIACKYSNDSCSIYKDGTEIDRSALTSRRLFNESSNWRVDLSFAANGNLDRIDFSKPSGTGAVPTTVDEAKSLIATTVGASASDTWSSIVSKLSSLANINEKRENFATLLDIPASSDWDTIYSKVSSLLLSRPASLTYEQFIVYPGTSQVWTMDSPSFCYVRAGGSYGLVVFSGTGYTFKGDFDDSTVAVDVGAKSIHNFSSSAFTVYVVKE